MFEVYVPKEKSTDSSRPAFISAYDKKSRVRLSFPSTEGRTRQEFKAEADINVIMKRYEKTGVIEYVQKLQPQYADITGRDFNTAMNLIADARSAFEELPAALRLRFDNDPAELLDFISDADNYDEAAELGLLDAAKVAARAKAQEAAGPAANERGAADPRGAVSGEPPKGGQASSGSPREIASGQASAAAPKP